jgi:DNA primase
LARIPESVIEEVRARADIVQVVGRYVTLKKAGRQWSGRCPFHDEKTPSFQVSEEKQVFYCFGCQEGGNIFSFLMKHNGLDFPEAVSSLARELGVAIPEKSEGESRATQLYAANDSALEYFRGALRAPTGQAARAYLDERGLPSDLIDRFQLGFAPAKWDGLLGHLRGAKQAGRAALDLGLIKKRDNGEGFYDAFRGRVIFPIIEPGGRVIGFGGRALSDDGPKYINSPESPIYHKSRVLFGLPQAVDAIRKSGRAIVVEGYFDVIALHRAGLPEAVAPCGTALTVEHARRLHRYANEVVLLFDGDAAGERASRRALPQLLAEGLRVRAVFLPPGEDPDTIVRSAGAAALRTHVDGAVYLLDHLIEQELKRNIDSPSGAADAARELAPFIRAIPDPVELAAYTRKLSSYLQLPAAALAAAVGPLERSPQADRPQPSRSGRVDPTVRDLLRDVLCYPDLARHLSLIDGDWIGEGIERGLISVLSEAIEGHGPSAVARLVAPEESGLPPELAAELQYLAGLEPRGDEPATATAVLHCIAKLELGYVMRAMQEIKSQLASGSREEQSQLLEQYEELKARKQQIETTRGRSQHEEMN